MIQKRVICKSTMTDYPFIKDIFAMLPELEQLYLYTTVYKKLEDHFKLIVVKNNGVYPSYSLYVESLHNVIGYNQFEIGEATNSIWIALIFQKDFSKHKFVQQSSHFSVVFN